MAVVGYGDCLSGDNVTEAASVKCCWQLWLTISYQLVA